MKVAFDVDYTLVNPDQSIHWPVLDYLRLFLRDGHEIIIWSAGGLDYATHQGKRLLGDINLKIYEDKIIFSTKNKQASEYLKPDICFDDQIVDLARVNIHVSNIMKPHVNAAGKEICSNCERELVPDLVAVTFGTDKWDGHTYKFACDCIGDKNLRVSIG